LATASEYGPRFLPFGKTMPFFGNILPILRSYDGWSGVDRTGMFRARPFGQRMTAIPLPAECSKAIGMANGEA
jgi:hypothetical protein